MTVGQIEEARRITEIAAVQVELSLWNDDNVLSGVVDYCIAQRHPAARVSAARRRDRAAGVVAADPVLADIAARHGATPFEIALAWLHGSLGR